MGSVSNHGPSATMDWTKKRGAEQWQFWLEPKSLMGTSILWRPAHILTSRDMERWLKIFMTTQNGYDMVTWYECVQCVPYRWRLLPLLSRLFWAPKGAWDVHVGIAAPGSQEDRSGAEGWQNQCRWFHRVKPGGFCRFPIQISRVHSEDRQTIYIIYPLVNWHRPWK